MNKDLTKKIKLKLDQEESVLELELADIGMIDPANPKRWMATTGSVDTGTADLNILADEDEEQETNKAIVRQLQKRFNDVKEAQERVDKGVHGICDVCKKDIEEERMLANPAAKTCIDHVL